MKTTSELFAAIVRTNTMTIEWDRPVCAICGYFKDTPGSSRCPECGFDPAETRAWQWHRWPRLARTAWLLVSPFVCHAMSGVGDDLVDRASPIGLAASLLAVVVLLLLPVECVLIARTMRGEPLSLTLKLAEAASYALAGCAAATSALMLAVPS